MTNDQSENKKVKPEDNPWYLLATLYGQPEPGNYELRARNRTAWNRYMAAEFTEEYRAQLIKEKPHFVEDLKPFSTEEMDEVKKTFSERYRQAARTTNETIPDLKRHKIAFSNADFDRPFWAENFFFPVQNEFNRSPFKQSLFDGAIFSSRADFNGATFSDSAVFEGATFSDSAVFEGATFSDRAVFEGATFSSLANFKGATFSSLANFKGTTFSDRADFSGAIFSRGVNFEGATFSEYASFNRAIFQLGPSFVNAEMKGPTSFQTATFNSAPPQFFGAKLHEGTVWRHIKWPVPPMDDERAGMFVDAYERLKLEMDRLKKHEDELNFFALELQSRRVLNGNWLRGFPITLYGLFCNYGRSYVRPLYGLLFTTAIGVLSFWWHFGLSNFWQAVGLSLANTFGVLGFRKDFIASEVM